MPSLPLHRTEFSEEAEAIGIPTTQIWIREDVQLVWYFPDPIDDTSLLPHEIRAAVLIRDTDGIYQVATELVLNKELLNRYREEIEGDDDRPD